MEIYLTQDELANSIMNFIELNTPFIAVSIDVEMAPPTYDWLTLIAHYSVDMDYWNEQDIELNNQRFLENYTIKNGGEEKISLTKDMLTWAIMGYIHRMGLSVDNIIIDLADKEVQRYFKVVIYSKEPAPTEEQLLAEACLNYRHDFGLLSKEEQTQLIFQAKEWKLALTKAGLCYDY
jgi:uncharacterized surface anchored protein